MRALTDKQPWASLIMAGVKDVENRTWPVPSTLPQWYRCTECTTRLALDSENFVLGGAGHDDFGLDIGDWHVDEVGDSWPRCGRLAPDGPFPFRLAIHAGKTADHFAPFMAREAFSAIRSAPGVGALGVLLGYVTVTGCHHANDRECRGKWWPEFSNCSPWAEPDSYHWTLADPEPLPEPIPMRGRQGLWTLPEELAA